MRVCLGQITADQDPELNLRLVADQATAAAEQGADLLVLPEATMASFSAAPRRAAEPEGGPWSQAVAEVARKAGLTIAVGMFTWPDEPAANDRTTNDQRVRNTLLVTDGTEHRSYHKRHLYDAYGFTESRTVAPGDDLLVTEIAGVGVGAAICYDLRFSAHFLALADGGARVIIVAASWAAGPNKADQWRTLARARAMDSTCWVLACGQSAPAQASGPVPLGVGGSLVVDPYGNVVAEAAASPEQLVVDLDLGLVDRARDEVPVLANRR
ncbi:carbon-nitrogen hydrolase family protein [Parenemella sanctibonifatiensis]|uniref:CN hydrolase domain-containing protein n=1 Tax=Parenemella sanctibonifatiensis TaxID=2016505 RepID=A0A255EPY4_9ACTN|nr:carbon-nitrogen hydrolase family protein [Parenemella sanctibonifatiensis]OYN90183.1 hypothetical protein CGZ91_08410 [Parenemella sanctibonifatiensis]